jgi:hypothetical protein
MVREITPMKKKKTYRIRIRIRIFYCPIEDPQGAKLLQ